MSRGGRAPPYMGACFPRVSGDEPERPQLVIPLKMFSPRERG